MHQYLNQVITHKRFEDVVFELKWCLWIPEKNLWKVKGLWINISNPEKPYYIGSSLDKKCAIPQKEASSWSKYDGQVP